MNIQFKIRLADQIIGIDANYASTKMLCQKYLIDAKTDFGVTITKEDIEYEKKLYYKKEAEEYRYEIMDEYFETLAVYRKIAMNLIRYDTLLFHGSVIAVDGIGYLFTAKSGTGKSTHTRLWRELFGERAIMINDDKPLIHVDNHEIRVYGTPWDGKHRLSTNTSVPLKSICYLKRNNENLIRKLNEKEMFPILYQQCFHPSDSLLLKRTMELLEEIAARTQLYQLKCNMQMEAAKVAYDGMNF